MMLSTHGYLTLISMSYICFEDSNTQKIHSFSVKYPARFIQRLGQLIRVNCETYFENGTDGKSYSVSSRKSGVDDLLLTKVYFFPDIPDPGFPSMVN